MKKQNNQGARTMLFKVRWMLTLSINWVISLLSAKEVWVLSLVIAVLFGLGWGITGSKSKAFHYLFDAGAAQNIGTGIIFFITWLVGGGVLVSVMIAQYYRNIGGYFRRWPWLVKNHVVVLGWDDGMLMEVKKAVEQYSTDCYIVTQQNILALRKSLKSAGLERVILYKGDYDDPKEWHVNLNIKQAVRVFIAGEHTEEAHDARVKLLFDELINKVPLKKLRVNIHDFGLAWKLRSMPINANVFENFHLKWADALWNTLADRYRWSGENRLSELEVFIVGFGAMGKAVAITLPGSFAVKTTVSVSDDDEEKLADEFKRYKNQFGLLNAVEEPPCEWENMLKKIQDGNKVKGSARVIVVAKKRSEKGMLCMMDIISRLGENVHKNDVLALSQEIEGADMSTSFASMQVGNAEVILFGMKKGCCAEARWLPDVYRNAYAKSLVDYANAQGWDLVSKCGIQGARFVLGGSLAYDAALKDGYDIDLRLLLPDGPDVHAQIDYVRDLLVEESKGDSTFKTRFIDEGGMNYIQHTKRIVRIPGIEAEVELSWNIQSAGSYRSIGEMATRLPRELIDRFVVAKWNARESGEEIYGAVKAAWRRFVEDLIDRGAREMSDGDLLDLLESLRPTFPCFLTEPIL